MSLTTNKKTKHILVVDDVADNTLFVRVWLENFGYKVNTAESGKTALTCLATEIIKPDLIILDLMMPEMNGYEVINCLRHRESFDRIPVLLMTANTTVSYESATNAGANELIYKPLDLEQLLKKVESLEVV